MPGSVSGKSLFAVDVEFRPAASITTTHEDADNTPFFDPVNPSFTFNTAAQPQAAAPIRRGFVLDMKKKALPEEILTTASKSGENTSKPVTTASEGNGTTYPTMEEAVLAMFDEINAFYANRDKRLEADEYGGDIRRGVDKNGEKFFFYDSIEIGNRKKVNIRVKPDAIAWVHSHPPAGKFDRNPSKTDKENRRLSGDDLEALEEVEKAYKPVIAFLAGPDGVIRRFMPGDYKSRGTAITDKGYVKYD